MNIPSNIIISRTDSLGDVVLTLPVAAVLKKYFPVMKIGFMGNAYTQPVIEACKNVDEFIDVNNFMHEPVTICGERPDAILHVFPAAKIALKAKQYKIPVRIGTANRWYHFITCNQLVKLSRKNSPYHEVQLNLKLLQPLGIDKDYSLKEIKNLTRIEKLAPLPALFLNLIQANKYNLILHPKTQGSAREWGLNNFIALIRSLDPEQYCIFISGTKKERPLIEPLLHEVGDRITDITGMMNLQEFMSFISCCDGLVANSTGPLHIAAALGKDALGIYAPVRPVHPGRWAPVGPKTQVFVLNKPCTDCKSKNQNCHCIIEVKPVWVKERLDKLAMLKLSHL